MKTYLAMGAAVLLMLACGTHPGTPQAVKNNVPPKVVSLSQPAYPEEARKAGIEGTAFVQVTIAADGAVFGCSLLTSSGNGPLDQAALQAARESKFAPGTVGGKPVEMKVNVPFRFRLDEGPKDTRGQVPGDRFWTGQPDVQARCGAQEMATAPREA